VTKKNTEQKDKEGTAPFNENEECPMRRRQGGGENFVKRRKNPWVSGATTGWLSKKSAKGRQSVTFVTVPKTTGPEGVP